MPQLLALRPASRPCSAGPPPLLVDELARVLLDRDPNPEPCHELYKCKGEEEPVAQRLAAAGRAVVRANVGCLGMGHAARGRRPCRAARGREVRVYARDEEDGGAQRGLGRPVMEEPDFLGHRQGHEVGDADKEQHDAEECCRRGGSVEGRCFGLGCGEVVS